VGLDNEGRAIASARVEPQKSNRLESLIRVAADGKSYEELIGELDDCYFMKLSPDQRFLAITPFPGRGQFAGKGFSFDVWDIASAKLVKHCDGHWNEIRQLEFSSDSKKIATAAFFTDVIKIWSLEEAASE
jgi:WD40 repeat protein